MSVITITLDYATDVYPYTDETDLDTLISEHVHEAVDNSLIYTQDIIDTWQHYGHPEPEELGMADSLSGSVTNAVYEALMADYSDLNCWDTWYDSRDEYAAQLLGQLGTVSFTEWDESALYTPEELSEALAGIAELDAQDAHEVLLAARDLISAVA